MKKKLLSACLTAVLVTAATVAPAYATTGNYGGEGYNLLYFQRKPISDFMFVDPVAHWLPSEDKIRYYNTRIPMTLLGYTFGGGKENY